MIDSQLVVFYKCSLLIVTPARHSTYISPAQCSYYLPDNLKRREIHLFSFSFRY